MVTLIPHFKMESIQSNFGVNYWYGGCLLPCPYQLDVPLLPGLHLGWPGVFFSNTFSLVWHWLHGHSIRLQTSLKSPSSFHPFIFLPGHLFVFLPVIPGGLLCGVGQFFFSALTLFLPWSLDTLHFQQCSHLWVLECHRFSPADGECFDDRLVWDFLPS